MNASEIERVTPDEARQLMAEGGVLVCAYEDEQKCQQLRLDGALTLGELQSRKSSLAKDTPVIFYCA
jgi:hypothetical protein